MFENWGKYSDTELFTMIHDNHSNKDKAFAEIYHRYSDKIFSYCLKILGNYDDAKDIFQETFIKFYNKIQETKLSGSLSGLLFTFARNESLNYSKKKNRFVELKEKYLPKYFDNLESGEMIEMLARALDLLPFIQKEAFVLRHYQGLSYEEISKICFVDQATVRNRVKRAIQSLQNILKPIFEEPQINTKKKVRKDE